MEVCSKPHLISGTVDEFDITDPYKFEKDRWSINFVQRVTHIRHIVSKPTKEEIISFLQDNSIEIKFYQLSIFDGGDNFLRDEYFVTENECNTYIVLHNIEQKKITLEDQKKAIEKEVSFIDKYLEEGKNDNYPTDLGEMQQELSMDEVKARIKKEYAENETLLKNKARNILISVAKLYLKGKKITDEDYVKYKMKIGEEALAEILIQLYMSKKAIYNLYEKIESGELKSTSAYDSLATMQRLAFDISKYQMEYLTDMEKSMKSINLELEDDITDISHSEITDTNLFQTNDIKQLNKEIKLFIDQGTNPKIPKSVNKRLHDDDENVGEEIILKEEESTPDDPNTKTNALDTWKEGE